LLQPGRNQQNGQSTTARRAAEALFTPKQEHHAPEPKNTAARKPRILAAMPPARLAPVNTVVSPVQETRRTIPKSQIDRIRTWLKYGMTIPQAAGVSGVSVSDLKDALRPHPRNS
jgi:hypothetical protein